MLRRSHFIYRLFHAKTMMTTCMHIKMIPKISASTKSRNTISAINGIAITAKIRIRSITISGHPISSTVYRLPIPVLSCTGTLFHPKTTYSGDLPSVRAVGLETGYHCKPNVPNTGKKHPAENHIVLFKCAAASIFALRMTSSMIVGSCVAASPSDSTSTSWYCFVSTTSYCFGFPSSMTWIRSFATLSRNTDRQSITSTTKITNAKNEFFIFTNLLHF